MANKNMEILLNQKNKEEAESLMSFTKTLNQNQQELLEMFMKGALFAKDLFEKQQKTA